MNDENNQLVELNYSMILMRHLDRISKITTFMPLTDMQTLSNFEASRETALRLSAGFFISILPEELRDKKYLKDFDKLSKLELNEGDNPIYNLKKIQTIVNLLNRKGYLIESEGFMKYVGVNK